MTEPLVFIKCTSCGQEEPAWFNHGEYDIPPSWRAMSTECCPEEFYACTPRCSMQLGWHLSRHHHGEVIIREVEALMDDDEIMEMLSECEAADGIAGGPDFNNWEREFLDSCREQMGNDRMLSGKQIEKLQELWDRV